MHAETLHQQWHSWAPDVLKGKYQAKQSQTSKAQMTPS